MLRKYARYALLLFVAFACLSGCAKQPQTFTLVLPANPTTGYEWSLTQTPPLLDAQSEYVPDPAAAGLAGGGGAETFLLTANKAGETALVFTYARPWESSDSDITLTYNVKVDRRLRVTLQSVTADVPGKVDILPEIPQPVIK